MKTNVRLRLAFVGAVVVGAAWIGNSASSLDAFPTGTVRIIVPTAPGGTADALPRIVAESLTTTWSKPVVVENVAGAGGNIGADQFNRAPPDGHTLLSAPPNSLAINQSLYRKIAYDPKAFEPITILASAPNVLIVNVSLGVNSVPDLIAKAKAEPGKYSFASQGTGSTGHLTGVLLETAAGIKLNHIPYRGTGPAMTDLLGGHVGMMFDNLASSLPHHRSGKLKIIAVCTPQRLAAFPDIPTIAETLPGFASSAWFGMAAPPQTPKDIVAKINSDVLAALKTQETRIKALGVDVIGNSPADAAAFLTNERARWSGVIDKANIKID